jgi:NTP pyrophosphatase (non-canonical NTP hydrolase)
MPELTAIYEASLAKWGVEGQYDQAIEECAELITALMHLRRQRNNEDEVIAELADVTLMVGQLTYMFGAERVAQAKAEKVAKLHVLLGA